MIEAQLTRGYPTLESIPDITPLLKPTTFGDFATYFFASAGGLFLGGELGMFPLHVITPVRREVLTT